MLTLLQFEDNAVYLVESAGRRHVLRMSVTEGRSPAEQASEIAWMEALAAEGSVLVPALERTYDGQAIVATTLSGVAEQVTAVLFEWIPGEPAPKELPSDVATALGRATAELHAHAMNYRPPAWFVRPGWGHANIFTTGSALTGRLAAERLGGADLAMLVEVSAAVANRLPEPTPDDWGIIHADLHRGNVVLTPTGAVSIIDFDDCGWGYYLLDIATVLSSVLRVYLDDRAAYSRFATDYLAGYCAVRDLPPSRAAISEFLVMRDMIILNFLLGSQNEQVQSHSADRSAGIMRLMRRYLETGSYDGAIVFTA